MQQKQQDVLLRGGLEQGGAYGRLRRGVEGVSRGDRELPLQVGRCDGAGLEGGAGVREYVLDGKPGHLVDHRAQALVAQDDIGQGGLERGPVHFAVETGDDRHGVRRRGAPQLLEEPEAELAGGDRQRDRPAHGP